MNYIQKDTKKWLDEINGAIDVFGDISQCSEMTLKIYVREAPKRAALINGIGDGKIIKKMEKEAWNRLEVDLKNGADLRRHFRITFALAYLDALVAIGLISETMAQDIMEANAPELTD